MQKMVTELEQTVAGIFSRIEADFALLRALVTGVKDHPCVAEAEKFELTVKQAAGRAGCSADTIERACRAEGLGEQVGGRWMVGTRRLEDFMEKRRGRSAGPK